MRTANYAELRDNMEDYLDTVAEKMEPLIVRRIGGENLIIIPMGEYSAIDETEDIMSSPVMMDIIRQGDREIKEGKGQAYSLEELKEKMGL